MIVGTVAVAAVYRRAMMIDCGDSEHEDNDVDDRDGDDVALV